MNLFNGVFSKPSAFTRIRSDSGGEFDTRKSRFNEVVNTGNNRYKT